MCGYLLQLVLVVKLCGYKGIPQYVGSISSPYLKKAIKTYILHNEIDIVYNSCHHYMSINAVLYICVFSINTQLYIISLAVCMYVFIYLYVHVCRYISVYAKVLYSYII